MYGGVGQVLHVLVPAVSVNVWVGICLGDHARGSARRRLRAHRAVRDGEGRAVHAADGVRGRGAAPPARRRDDGRSRVGPQASRCLLPVSSPRSPSSGSPASARPSSSCIPTGASRRATRGSSGRDEPAPEWIARARGWIRVMHFDILCSLVIYTMATVAFYLLGAGVLHRMGVDSGGARHRRGPLADLHADARRLGALALLCRRRRHAVRDDLRVDGRALADDGRSRPRRSASIRAKTPNAACSGATASWSCSRPCR